MPAKIAPMTMRTDSIDIFPPIEIVGGVLVEVERPVADAVPEERVAAEVADDEPDLEDVAEALELELPDEVAEAEVAVLEAEALVLTVESIVN
jgi:hypothetical protein